MANVLRAYKSRYDALSHDPRIAHITIFKNHGWTRGQPGASAFPVDCHSGDLEPGAGTVPVGVAATTTNTASACSANHWKRKSRNSNDRACDRTFRGLGAFCLAHAVCTHIYPRRHMASFGDISAAEIADLARMLRTLYWPSSITDWEIRTSTTPALRARRVGRSEVFPLVCEHHSAPNPRRRVSNSVPGCSSTACSRKRRRIFAQREGRIRGWSGRSRELRAETAASSHNSKSLNLGIRAVAHFIG